ncbi:MAG: DUF2442 domain-containing protein [Vicinamibacteria bacterium]
MTTMTDARPQAREIEFTEDTLVIHVKDGRTLSVPLVWFPRLLDATTEQRRHFETSDGGEALHWPDVDEDISVPGLFGLPC